MPRNRSPASPHGRTSWPVRFTTWFSPGFGRILSDRIACQSARFKKGEPLAHPFLFPAVFTLGEPTSFAGEPLARRVHRNRPSSARLGNHRADSLPCVAPRFFLALDMVYLLMPGN